MDKKSQEIVNYLNSIDFSIINDVDVLDNIYNEITPFISTLCKDPFVSSSLEKLILLSNSSQLLNLLDSIDKRVVNKKLGSRIIEKIFERLFDCMYKNNDAFQIERAINFLNFKECAFCHNATFVLRKALMLISGKYIEKLKIQKYKNTNKEYCDKIISEIKNIYITKIDDLQSSDVLNTLGVFLQISKSQSLIKIVIEKNCTVENIRNNGFFYEILPTVANKKNLDLLFEKTKENFLELSHCEKSSYFLQSFLRNSFFGVEFYNKINEDIENFDINSNIILSAFESIQKNIITSNKKQDVSVKIIDDLIKKFYKIDGSVFEDFLLSRHGSLDSKFVNIIVNFMKIPSKYNYCVNQDFLRLFNKDWIKNKSGIALLIGFVEGSFDQKEKSIFVEKNIDLFWDSYKWKEGKKFVKIICNLTKGHSRKKAFEMLSKFE